MGEDMSILKAGLLLTHAYAAGSEVCGANLLPKEKIRELVKLRISC